MRSLFGFQRWLVGTCGLQLPWSWVISSSLALCDVRTRQHIHQICALLRLRLPQVAQNSVHHV